MSTLHEVSKDGDKLILDWDETDKEQHKAAVAAVKRITDKGGLVYEVEDEHVEVGGKRVSTHKKQGRMIRAEELKQDKKRKLLSRRPFVGG